MLRFFSSILLAGVLSAGCEPAEAPLPEDLYEDGWDQTTRPQRLGVLRQDLRASLDTLASLEEGSDPHAAEARRSSGLLSALRAELVTTPKGRDEYESFERELEHLAGDSL